MHAGYQCLVMGMSRSSEVNFEASLQVVSRLLKVEILALLSRLGRLPRRTLLNSRFSSMLVFMGCSITATRDMSWNLVLLEV